MVAPLVAIPPGVVTETTPEELLAGITVSTVPVFEEIEVTAVPPIVIPAAVAPVRLVPLMTNEPPLHPEVEPKLLIVGV